ncbi:MAG: N-acetyltransferase [Proteobacteria bacterium]|nr:N-acetyltransferase [Pseudomonadota bacterium]
MIRILPHSAADDDALELLLLRAFGPGREKKTVYRLRDGVPQIDALGFAAFDGEALRGSIQFWPAQVQSRHASTAVVPILMLGPLAVDPDYAGQGIGKALMEHALDIARSLGYRIAFLVGDEPYYARVGFHRAGAEGLRLPGPVDPARLLILELEPGAALGLEGMIEKSADEAKSPASPIEPSRTEAQ